MTSTAKYWAFISYSHADEQWGRWLHKRIESYRVPARLVRHTDGESPLPKRLFPVFRDRDELASAPELGSKIEAALRESRNLIVVCSPASAGSRWVNEEIRYFKSLGRADQVFCLIVDGEPGDPRRECFPRTVLYALDESGQLSDRAVEPIAADARPQGDGKTNALLKLVAGMLGVGFDQLKQRDLAARNRRLTAVAGAAVTVAVVTVALAVFALQQRERAEQRRAEAESLVQFMMEDLNSALTGVGRTDLLANVAERAVGYFARQDDREKSTATRLHELRARLTAIGTRAAGRSVEDDLIEVDGMIAALRALVRDNPDLPTARADLAFGLSTRAGLADTLGNLDMLGQATAEGLEVLETIDGRRQHPELFAILSGRRLRWQYGVLSRDADLAAEQFNTVLELSAAIDEAEGQRTQPDQPNISGLIRRAVAYENVIGAAVTLPAGSGDKLEMPIDQSIQLYTDRMIAALHEVLESVPTHVLALNRLGTAYQLRSVSASRTWDGPETLKNAVLARELQQRLDFATPGNNEVRLLLAYSVSSEAIGEYLTGETLAAAHTAQRSADMLKALYADNPGDGNTAVNWLAVLTGTTSLWVASGDLERAQGSASQAMQIIRNPPDERVFEGVFGAGARFRSLADAAELHRLTNGRLGEDVAGEFGDLLFQTKGLGERMEELRGFETKQALLALRWLLVSGHDAQAAAVVDQIWQPNTGTYFRHRPVRSACEWGWLPKSETCALAMAQPPARNPPIANN